MVVNSDSSRSQFAKGAIVRIKLENFVTYDSLEFRPGPNLNVIIGPNGTGKSTIVCAICLGMTGKPAVLGRASNVCDFIKYGKNTATVEIELNNPNSNNNHVIRRVIYKDSKSDWFINDKQKKLKDVEELVEQLNIQVGNLCQFLPQEKVAEFARMNPQELLENTEKAVGGLELFETHQELKERCKVTRDLERDLRLMKETICKEEAINQRLENQVKSYLDKRKNEQSIIWLKRKKSCLVYREKKEEYEQVKKDRDRLNVEIKKLTEKFAPILERKKEIDRLVEQQKNTSKNKTQQIQDFQKSERELKLKIGEYNEKIAEVLSDYKNKETEFKSHKSKLKEIEKSIEALMAEYEEAKSQNENYKTEESRLKARETQLRDDHQAASTKEFEIRQLMTKCNNEIDDSLRQINEMKNVREEKLSKLRERNKDTYAAIQWVERNRANFNGTVYEPMFLQINVQDKNFVKYVENAIPMRDLTSMFLFEDSNDMHHFMSEVRDKMGLTVNAALVPRHKLDDFQPPKDINELKKFGFQTYLREVIEAPEAILIYLCLYASIHQVPIGNRDTQKNISTILPHISELSRIYTSTHQYSFSRSRYTNKVSSTSAEVPESFWLTSSINQSKLGELEQAKKRLEVKMKELQENMRSHADEKHKIDKQIDIIRMELNKLREKQAHVDGIHRKLTTKKSLLASMEKQNVDMVQEASTRVERTSELSRKKAKAFAAFLDTAKKLSLLNKDKLLAIYHEAMFETERSQIDAQLRTFNSQKQELDGALEQVNQALNDAKEEAKLALDNASKMNETQLEKGLPPEYKAKFSTLPDTIEGLEAEIHQLEAIAQCANDVDDRVVEEYNRRQAEIERMQHKCQKLEDKLNGHVNNYEAIKNDWLDKVTSMLDDINVKFSGLFKQLKCAGEVVLSRPDNAEEFNKYGISIRVSFRSDEQLQELTAWQQSGGEKSVSTMLYMIALQEMTKCPFRVVDEINQGMDPVNERKVFEIIVQNSCSRQQAQYFLLTPKLLPDLRFDDKANVICVFNGPYNIPHSNYNLKKFLQLRAKINDEEDDEN